MINFLNLQLVGKYILARFFLFSFFFLFGSQVICHFSIHSLESPFFYSFFFFNTVESPFLFYGWPVPDQLSLYIYIFCKFLLKIL